MAKIICAFAGLAKTFLAKKYNNVIDFDLTEYKYIYTKEQKENFEELKGTPNRNKNKDYPINWLEQLKKLMNTDYLILVPADLEIRDLLIKNKINFLFVMPDLDSEKTLIKRYKKRGNNKLFIERAIFELKDWNKQIPYYKYKTIILPKPYFLEDWLIKEKII